MTSKWPQRAAFLFCAGLVLLVGGVAKAWTVDMEIQVAGHVVQYDIRVCNDMGDDSSVWVDLYYHSDSAPPTSGGVGNVYWSANITTCRSFVHTRFDVPNGAYNAWVQVNSRPDNNQVHIHGPEEYRVGPDLFVQWAGYEIDGASLKYKARVCNVGTDVARNFRVGFYFNLPPSQYPAGPPDGTYSDKFKSLEKLEYDNYWWWRWYHVPWPVCKDVEHDRHNTPNGIYWSWVKVDSGQFVLEANENNNVWGPMFIDMANPDLEVVKFDAEISKNKPYTVTYYIKVRNKGAATARVFWIDLYYDRKPTDPPQLGEPGELQIRVDNLGVGEVVEEWVTWRPPLDSEHERGGNYVYDCNDEECEPNEKCLCDPERAPCLDKHWIYNSWLPLDSDEFVSDPDRSDNLDGALEVRIPRAVVPNGCEDSDGDGYGVGKECDGIQDCDDDNAALNPGAPEECGDGVDNDCDGNIDNCCPGVDCCDDEDGDQSPVGSDCQLPDCDDEDPTRSPLFLDECGDGIDNDCDGIPDDCCPGGNCCDQDNDGYGVGEGCPEPQDCNDGDPNAGANLGEEICGDGLDNDCDGIVDDCCPGVLCCDQDNDGYGVGVGCPGPQDPDDNDPNNPSENEECGDGIDNNLNGTIDEGCPCNDHDGDGYCVGGNGDCNTTNPGECPNPGDDCDDNDDTVHPGADEICDGTIDQNCNGTIDDQTSGGEPCLDPNCVMACATVDCVQSNCPNGEPACLYECGLQNTACTDNCSTVDCVDGDGDGWGTGPDCAWPDCDDGNPAVHPEAEEICDGVTDENCNGTIDDGTPGNLCPEPACVIECASHLSCAGPCGNDQGCLYECGATNAECVSGCDTVDCVDADGDGWGVGEDCAEGTQDPDDNDPAVHPGAGEICGDGLDQNGDGVADDGCLLCIDLDRDGYGVGSHCLTPDCNDLNPRIHPHAYEACGGGDTNCDNKTTPKSECPDSGCAAAGGAGDDLALILALMALVGLCWRRRKR